MADQYTSPLTEREVRLLKAVRRFERAAREFGRAQQTEEQPRLNRAGTAYACAKIHLFAVAKEVNRV